MYNSKIIIALDFPDREKTFQFLNSFQGEKLFVKIGMELLYKEGLSIISEIKARGHQIFLDLKLYDIPNTVSSAIHSLGLLGVDLLTVHASGGLEMLKAAQKAAQEYSLNLLAVTVLTSQEVHELPKTDYSLNEIIYDLAQKSVEAKMFGIICSAKDIPYLKEFKDQLQFITPGIRLLSDDKNDQKRVTSPDQAIQNGANFLVIGRTITQSLETYQTYKKIQDLIGEKS
ncbi:MAG: orotidine-5'-phosphate decarboxylase [Lactovum sp.]